ncbi:twin-arginine translocation signal domain-containing protein [Haladaptatus sp. CMAA 1911]|uniref:twin-arginine translocation signal domain-containing protein n=1 Tax=unclassified Haladaptatus TaxID=2622732 RepID=UPI003753F011
MVDKKSNIHETAEQITEAVDNGGGCVEAWEAMSDLREKEQSNRRNFLKGIGAAGAGAFGLAGMGTTLATAEPSNTEVTQVLRSDDVQTILSELGQPDIDPGTVNKLVPENKVDDEQIDSLEVFEIPTDFGTIRYSVNESEAGAQFKFKQTGSRPQEYRKIPRNIRSGLAATNNELIFIREATTNERQHLDNLIDVDITDDNTEVVKTSDINGFRVVTQAKGEKESPTIYDVIFEDRDIADKRGELSSNDANYSSDDVSIQQQMVAQGCLSWCVGCVGVLTTGCPACAWFCYGVTTVPGAILCIGCWTGTCGIVLPVTCGKCLDCGT